MLVTTNLGKRMVVKYLFNWKSYLGLDKIPLATVLSFANIPHQEVTY